MKTVNITTSFQSLRSLTAIIAFAVMLFTTGVCAQGPTSAGGSKAVTDDDVVSLWIGKYEPVGRSKDILIINESTFNWGGCKAVRIYRIAQSEQVFAFEVDSSAKCGWAGWIVELSASPTESGITVKAYRSASDFKEKRYLARSPYVKR